MSSTSVGYWATERSGCCTTAAGRGVIAGLTALRGNLLEGTRIPDSDAQHGHRLSPPSGVIRAARRHAAGDGWP